MKHSPASPFLCPSLPPGGQVEREKLQTQEDSLRLSAEKGRLDRSLGTAERELAEAQQRIRLLQVGGPLLAQVGEVQAVAPLDAAHPLDAPFACSRMGLGSFWGSSQLGEMLVLPPRCAGLLLGSFPAWRDAGACTALILDLIPA